MANDQADSDTVKQGASLFSFDDALVVGDERLEYLRDALGQQEEVNDLLVMVVYDEGEGKLDITLDLESLLHEVV